MKCRNLNPEKMKTMKTYTAPKSVVCEFIEASLLAASLAVDNTPGQWEGDAARKGWSAENWSDTED